IWTKELREEAVSRNIGLIAREEQEKLRNATVAIAGMGAVGGHHLLTLARMGIGKFIIADPDIYEPLNLHRQAGAFVNTIGRGKAEVMAEMTRQINPEVELTVISEAIGENNVDSFLDKADIYLDGVDFFQVDARILIFQKAREKGIFAITAGPIGYGSSVQIFDPKGMTFEQYFGIKPGMTRAERIIAFAIGILPKLPNPKQMDTSSVDFEKEKGPALISAILMSSGIIATEALRVLLKRPGIKAVPYNFYFDPYGHSYYRGWAPFGRVRLRDRLMRFMAFRRYPSLKRLHDSEKEARKVEPEASERKPGISSTGTVMEPQTI
ncbi:MAG: ThiF family adenylyltransferase, partial [Verrucomicrobiota bacterium]